MSRQSEKTSPETPTSGVSIPVDLRVEISRQPVDYSDGSRLSETILRLSDSAGSEDFQRPDAIPHYGVENPAYSFLDHLFPCEFIIHGILYRSVEHYYQSQKTDDPTYQAWIASAPTPAEAKARGRQLEKEHPELIAKDWPQRKFRAMKAAEHSKFDFNPSLKNELLRTGTAVIYEDSPDDATWGGVDGAAARIIMEVRAEIRAYWDMRRAVGGGGCGGMPSWSFENL